MASHTRHWRRQGGKAGRPNLQRAPKAGQIQLADPAKAQRSPTVASPGNAGAGPSHSIQINQGSKYGANRQHAQAQSSSANAQGPPASPQRLSAKKRRSRRRQSQPKIRQKKSAFEKLIKYLVGLTLSIVAFCNMGEISVMECMKMMTMEFDAIIKVLAILTSYVGLAYFLWQTGVRFAYLWANRNKRESWWSLFCSSFLYESDLIDADDWNRHRIMAGINGIFVLIPMVMITAIRIDFKMLSLSAVLSLLLAIYAVVESVVAPMCMTALGVKRDTDKVAGEQAKRKNIQQQDRIKGVTFVVLVVALAFLAPNLVRVFSADSTYKNNILPDPTFQNHQLDRTTSLSCSSVANEKYNMKHGNFLLAAKCSSDPKECDASDEYCLEQSMRTFWFVQWRPPCERKGCDPDRPYENRYAGFTETSGNQTKCFHMVNYAPWEPIGKSEPLYLETYKPLFQCDSEDWVSPKDAKLRVGFESCGI